MLLSIRKIVIAPEIVHLGDNEFDFKLGLMQFSQKMVYFQYHLDCQHFTDN